MGWWRTKKDPKYEVFEIDIFLKTYRVKIYTTVREEPFEGIFKDTLEERIDRYEGSGLWFDVIKEAPIKNIMSSEVDYDAYRATTAIPSVSCVEGMKENISHFISSDKVKYVESEMIYRTPAKRREIRKIKK